MSLRYGFTLNRIKITYDSAFPSPSLKLKNKYLII